MYYIAGYVMYVARKQVQNFTLLVTLWKSRQQQLTRTLLPALGMEEYLLIPIAFNSFFFHYFLWGVEVDQDYGELYKYQFDWSGKGRKSYPCNKQTVTFSRFKPVAYR